jgi:CRP-like cAMP-binding protein
MPVLPSAYATPASRCGRRPSGVADSECGTPVDRGVWLDKRRRKFAAVDADIRAAVEASHLRALPPDALDELMLGSVRRRISAGSVTHREAGSAPYLELLMSGVVRAFVTAPDGRSLTVRYCHPGALIGVYTLFARPLATSGSTQALVESELVQMSPAVARRLAGTDVRIARALLTELSERSGCRAAYPHQKDRQHPTTYRTSQRVGRRSSYLRWTRS